MSKREKNISSRLGQKETRTYQDYRVIVPIFDNEADEWSVQVGLNLVPPKNGHVILVGVVVVPESESLSAGAAQAQTRRVTLERLRASFAGQPIRIKPRIRVGHVPWPLLARVVAEEQARVIILPWPGEKSEPAATVSLEELVNQLQCHLIIASQPGPTQPRHILMPTRGGKEAALALEVALAMARATAATITLLHISGNEPFKPISQQVYQELARMTQGDPWIKQDLRVEGEAIQEILKQAQQHDLVIVGATEAAPGSRQSVVGHTAYQLWQQGVKPLLVVKTYQPPPLEQLAGWRGAQPLPTTTTSVLVDKWFAENTFDSREFEALEHLVASKEEQNLTISLGLPALNEEKKVGAIIATLQDRLMRQLPLLDEIVLIDSGSSDNTVKIAQDFGLPVYQHDEILPEYGTFHGKGEALWKSLYILEGDLVAWIDTDIINIHPRFIYGILGPLLRHNTIQYVKGFYRRPLKVGDTLQASGGGRVTELVARPLINLFYPELSGIVQPLSGEYAGRRTALERVPFYTGYGVETGLLLALLERYGISGIAQVDLRRRIHHNQPLEALSQMAFTIIQVFINHLEQRQRVELLNKINQTMKIIRYQMDSYKLDEYATSDQHRPPMITLPEYRTKRGLFVPEPEVGGGRCIDRAST